MPSTDLGRRPTPSPSPARSRPAQGRDLLLFPSIYLERGQIVFPVEGEDRYEALRTPSGAPVDVFDAVDHLFATYHRLYVVDVEGVMEERPQFEYLQELSRGQEMWVDAGSRDADQVMDVLVAGATRAVLTTKTLHEAREVSRSLKLTSQVAFEIVLEDGRVVARDPALANASPEDLSRDARARGLPDIILSSSGASVDWALVGRVAEEGPTYVGGPFFPEATEALVTARARGGVFRAKEVLERWTTSGS